MITTKWWLIPMLLICGFMIGLQLANMYPNPEYAASWRNVGITTIIALFFIVSGVKSK